MKEPLVDNLARIEAIAIAAAELPKIDPLPANPSQDDLMHGYAKLAFAYASSTALLQQALPILVEELRTMRAEQQVGKRLRAKKVG